MSLFTLETGRRPSVDRFRAMTLFQVAHCRGHNHRYDRGMRIGQGRSRVRECSISDGALTDRIGKERGPMKPWTTWLARLGIAGACFLVTGCGGGDVPDASSDGQAATRRRADAGRWTAPPARRGAGEGPKVAEAGPAPKAEEAAEPAPPSPAPEAEAPPTSDSLAKATGKFRAPPRCWPWRRDLPPARALPRWGGNSADEPAGWSGSDDPPAASRRAWGAGGGGGPGARCPAAHAVPGGPAARGRQGHRDMTGTLAEHAVGMTPCMGGPAMARGGSAAGRGGLGEAGTRQSDPLISIPPKGPSRHS